MNSHSSFKFGSGNSFPSLYKVKIPAKIGSKTLFITTDGVDSPIIPLLLSRDVMKRAQTEINFFNNSVTMFGGKQNVHTTRSGHYTIPLNISKAILTTIGKEQPSLMTLKW